MSLLIFVEFLQDWDLRPELLIGRTESRGLFWGMLLTELELHVVETCSPSHPGTNLAVAHRIKHMMGKDMGKFP